ncbi:transcriptional regulator [Jatrophihabitans telluris]|uniref:Transcriptional regulator n=1 Tax=Jatrophihabitans telluris TaxID=2038343 RepID=A0ABY4R301_9ACTN|nr:transcriptional regulator [Jatrophihabitans telluris]
MGTAPSDNGSEAPDDREYARALGSRLRAVRSQQRLSLHGVERKSGGKWKAVVVGSYERGDRAVSVARLAELAEFYGVPISELLPSEEGSGGGSRAEASGKIVLDLQRMQGVPAEEAAPLIRYAQSIQRQRGDYGNKVLSIRGEDLRALALMFDTSLESLTEKLVSWGVLAPGSIGHPGD